MKKRNSSDIIPAMFLSTVGAMILSNLAFYLSSLIDGIITSRTLGHEAFSAISLFNPINGIFSLVCSSISVGAQSVISRSVGCGEKDRAVSSFTTASIITEIFALIFISAWLTAPGEIISITGISPFSHPGMYSGMAGYIDGYIYGLPLMMLVEVIGPVVVMDGGKTLFTASVFVMCAANIAGDLANGLIIHGCTFGMGLATSLSYLLQIVMLMTHFAKKNSYFGFSLKAFSPVQLEEIMKSGYPTLVKKFANMLRELFTNRFNLAVALTIAAVAAKGIQSHINTVLFCIGIGISKTLVTMTGIYYGAEDRKGLTQLFSYSLRMSVIISGAVGIAMFFSAPLIARAFSTEPEIIDLAGFSIRCLALGLVPDVVAAAFSGYFQGINSRKFLNALNILDRFILPVATAFVMGLYFGSKGIMASLAAGKIMLVVIMLAAVLLRTKRLPSKVEDFMFLPEGFGGDAGDNIYASISSTDDTSRESKRAEEFCLSHGVDKRKAELMSLFVEEVAVNIIEHGRAKRGNKTCVDYHLSFSGKKLCMTMRDYCEHFDPVAFYEANDKESPGYMPGISIVMKLANDVRYFSAFNSNNIIVSIDAEGDVSHEGNQH